jgi:two-component system, OmpR family, response regulator
MSSYTRMAYIDAAGVLPPRSMYFRTGVTSPPSILVIDDDPDIRRMAALSLERIGGFHVRLASGAEEALGAVGSEAPDVILLDVSMPGTDGPTTLEALRKIPSAEHIPVVFFTATSSAEEARRLVGLGALGVIPKPFEVADLPRRLREILARAP